MFFQIECPPTVTALCQVTLVEYKDVGMGVFPCARCVSQCEPAQIAWLRRAMTHGP